MILSLAGALLAATVVSAQVADTPVRPSAVRQALIEALGPGATAVKGASYGALVKAMTPEHRALARVRLDALDRERLSPEALTDLSKVYVLLGAHDPAAEAGLALQSRDPNGTRGLILAADAKMAQKDYAASAALAEQALKINPNDFDARRALHDAKGRIAPTSASNSIAPSGGDAPVKSVAAEGPVQFRTPVKARHEEPPPAPLKENPVPASPGGAPWLPYAIGGALTIYGIVLSIKHALERGKGALEQTAEATGKSADNLYFKGKDLFQDNPKTATAVCLGGVAAVVIGGWMIAPTLGLGGGAPLMLATAGGGTVTSAATASGVSVGALKVTAVTAVAAAPILMAGDGGGAAKDTSSKKSTSAQESRVKLKEKPAASDSELQRAIDKLYQPGDTLPGGTAGATENEFITRQPTSGRFHLQASKERLKWLERIVKSRPLSAHDRLTAELLMDDLKTVIRLYNPTP